MVKQFGPQLLQLNGPKLYQKKKKSGRILRPSNQMSEESLQDILAKHNHQQRNLQ